VVLLASLGHWDGLVGGVILPTLAVRIRMEAIYIRPCLSARILGGKRRNQLNTPQRYVLYIFFIRDHILGGYVAIDLNQPSYLSELDALASP